MSFSAKSNNPMASKEVEMGLMEERFTGESGEDDGSLEGKAKYQPVETFSTTSVFARTPIKSTDGYEIMMFQERAVFVFLFVFYALVAPLVFRYGMGSNLKPVEAPKQLKDLTNATMDIFVDWHDCVTCRDVIGVTVKNITVTVKNVTTPNPESNTPSLAIFASQDMNYWYFMSCLVLYVLFVLLILSYLSVFFISFFCILY
jgi:hypothetical protein